MKSKHKHIMPRHAATEPYRRRQPGFTLVEVLVVLIIIGIVSGVLFQALEHAYRLQYRFGSELFKVQQGQMAADWYRQTVQGLYPDYAEGRNLFQGDEREFSGLSLNPLGDDYGAPQRITWKLKRNEQNGSTELIYSSEQRETPILAWRSNKTRFIYLDELQAAHDSWPPKLGLWPQLPKQVHLVAEDAGETVIIVAAPQGPTTPPLRGQGLFGAP